MKTSLSTINFTYDFILEKDLLFDNNYIKFIHISMIQKFFIINKILLNKENNFRFSPIHVT